jgi:hypothetical protein
MIGARCADLIAEAVVSMEFKASAEDIKNVTRASYFAEAVKEAALAATDNRAMYSFYDLHKKTRQIIFDGFFVLRLNFRIPFELCQNITVLNKIFIKKQISMKMRQVVGVLE